MPAFHRHHSSLCMPMNRQHSRDGTISNVRGQQNHRLILNHKSPTTKNFECLVSCTNIAIAITVIIIIQQHHYDHCCSTTHRSITVAVLNEWKSNDAEKNEENGLRLRSRTTRLRSCEKVSNSGNGMQSSNILMLLYTKPHTNTRHVSCRVNSEMRLRRMWIVQKNGNAEANGIKRIMYDVVRCTL